jgi:hypothetical protein
MAIVPKFKWKIVGVNWRIGKLLLRKKSLVKGKSLAGELLERHWIGISTKVNDNHQLSDCNLGEQGWILVLEAVLWIKDKGKIFMVK